MPADRDKLPVDGAKSASGAVDAFVRKLAAMPAVKPAGRGRLIFALDATASREPTWDRACHLQGQMFEVAAELGGLEVQLVFYRGFGECKASTWVADARELGRRMTGVTCLGGQTQITKVLRHAIAETERRKVSALVFVGDCMEEPIDQLCHEAGRLGVLGVPAFLFHEGGDPVAANAFKQVARLTGGAYCPFDSASAQQLRDLLSAVAVFAAGGRPALEDYGRKRGGVALQIAHQVKGRP
jgi:hypothetical protein